MEHYLAKGLILSRLLLAGSLAAAAASGLAAYPASADRTHRSTLDDKGKPIGSAWSETGRFEALTATGMDDVRLVAGDRWRIRASGDARALAQLRFVVEKDGLIVGRTSHPDERYGKARIEITAPTLRAVTAAGSGALDVETIAGPRASATVAGSGYTTIRRPETERLRATVAGSGAARFRSPGKVSATIAGSGSVTVTGTSDCSQTRMGSGRLVCRR